MTVEMIKRIFEQIDRLELDQVTISWHGGEPLLFGKNGFREAFEHQRSLKTKFRNVVQTNGILIDDEWVDFFKENGFLVGISIDGDESLHNYNRPLRNGRDSFNLVLRGLNKLVDAGICGGIISVISKKAQAKSYFDFVQSLGVKSFNVKPCNSQWEGSSTPDDFAGFSKELFGLWIENDDPQLDCRTFKGFAENLLGGQANLCHQSGRCSYFMSINTNGDVYPCDELMPSENRLGNVMISSLSDILSSFEWNSFCSKLTTIYSDCKESCPDYDACGGGCTSERLFHGDESYCKGRRSIIASVREWVNANQAELA